MKIIKLTAANVKRIRAVEIVPKPDGSVVLIGGKNSQGKTSVLDAIAWAIGGKRMIPERPVRDGQAKAVVEVVTEKYTIERTVTATGNAYLKVKANDGGTLTSPQAILDGLMGELSFDPLQFARKPPREQRLGEVGDD